MKKIVSLVFLCVTCTVFSQVERPKLVVGIVVDQMRPDYLYRYYDQFGEGGFKRLMKEGFIFRNTNYNYMPTYTAPGHSSLYTGTTPSVHGIVGNNWFSKEEGKSVYCTFDDQVKSVGIDPQDKQGWESPKRLLATTVTDEFRLDTNFKGKVIGISEKDRAAILPAGHFANAAYWMSNMGDYITSTFYMEKLPQWVVDFNKKKYARKFVDAGWSLMKNPSEYTASTEDNTPYEEVFSTKNTPVFPYDLKTIAQKEKNLEIIKSTPYGNDMVELFAEAAIDNEKLGQGKYPDFLALSFSSTDYVGHAFGPRSVEIEDTYLRLDKNIENLLNHLDKRVGKGNYLLFLTADHAAAENPQYLKDRGYNVSSIDSKQVLKDMKNHFQEKYGVNIFDNYSNQNIFLNNKVIAEKNLDYDKIIKEVKEWMHKKPFVSRVYSREDILRGNPTDYNLCLIERGYDPKQNGDLMVLLRPQYLPHGTRGTSHGTSYMYDTNVPNIWYGWKVKPGISYKRYNITSIAPTISQKLSIPMPNGTQGELLEEILP